MGKAAFIPLNGGRRDRESAKQAEIALASLLKILQVRRCGVGCQPDLHVAAGRVISAVYG
jgi:hypothetical protein